MRGASWWSGVRLVAAAVAGLFVLAAPAQAQKVPDGVAQEVLIKSTLLSFNDANITGNYEVLHAKSSKPFRDMFPPDKMKDVFKDFANKHIDIAMVVTQAPVADKAATINDNGVLLLEGHFDTSPKPLRYSLGYIMSDGEWKPVKINVDIK